MEYLEEIAIGSTFLKPSMPLRHIDYIFILWPQEDILTPPNHVYSIRSSIQFSMEKELDNKLSFLDVSITYTK